MSLREQAQQVIRASILAGELAAGEIYSASTLAERLGVSPTPVREAMLELANGGLVEAVRTRGFRILTADEDDLDEISQLRLMLEVPSMRIVAERASDDEVRALRDPREPTSCPRPAAGSSRSGRRRRPRTSPASCSPIGPSTWGCSS